MAAHLIMPFEVSNATFFLALMRHRFDFDEVAVIKSNEIATRMTNGEIVRNLRDNVENRWTPPARHRRDSRPHRGPRARSGHPQPRRVGNPIAPETVEQALTGIKKDDIREDYHRRIDG